jgi:hypothetical protein
MDVQINWLAVVLATISTMVVGTIWYARAVFGNLWIKLAKVDEKKMANNWTPMVLTFIASLVTAYVLAHVSYLANMYFHNSFLQDTLMTAFWLWLGFVAARLLTHDAFEGRLMKLTILNIAHEFVTIIVMALIIGLMQP